MKRYVFLAIFIFGFLAGARGPDPSQAVIAGINFVVLAGLVYFVCKALSVIGDRIVNWKETNPGEPIFKVGEGLTEYDAYLAKRTGEEVARAIEASKSKGGDS